MGLLRLLFAVDGGQSGLRKATEQTEAKVFLYMYIIYSKVK